MHARLSVLIALTVVGGCADLPPGLGPDPDARSIAIYVPAAAGQPASIELAPAPDNSWRTASPTGSPSDLGDRLHSPLTLAGDEGKVFATLIEILTPPGALSSDDLAIRLGPPPIADLGGPRVQIERVSRACGAAYGVAARPDIHPRLCPSPNVRHQIWRLALTGAGLSVDEVVAALESAGYRALGETPVNPNLHPPLPGTENAFIRTARDPMIAVAHLRQGSGSAVADSLFLLWPAP